MPLLARPLKILILLNRVPFPLNDGGAIGAYNFVKGYADAGCVVTMLAMNTSKHFVEEATARKVLEPFGKLFLIDIDNRIKPLRAGFNLISGKSYIIERFISKNYQNRLIELLQKEAYDVVHVDGIPPASYINSIRKYSTAKVAMRAHNVEHIIWQRIAEKETKALKKWYVALQATRLKEFEIHAFAQCDVVLAISKEDELTIHQSCPTSKTIIVPAGMDISDAVQNTNFNPMDLCFIGSFDWMPNQQGMDWFLQKIWPGVKAAFPEIKFHIAGKKTPKSLLETTDKNIVIHGEVPDASEFMLQHGLMVVPVISGSGIRIKILEAMALGKVVLATDLAIEGLGLQDGETVLRANTAEDFIRQIALCRKEDSIRRLIGHQAHRFAYDHYRNSAIFDRLLTEYQNIL